jgi:hypothetical protein
MITQCSLPPFLRLPVELRFNIYDYLCGKEPRSYPFKYSPVSSIDQTPPPTALQLTCRNIHEEIQAYFQGHATLRFVAGSYWSHEVPARALQAIRLAKKIEIVLIWRLTLQLAKTNMSKGPGNRNEWLVQRVDLLLREAEGLELVILSVQDVSHEEADWESKRKMLSPMVSLLNKLPSNVTFSLGEVTADGAQEEKLRGLLSDHLKKLNAR